jgi:UDP:flavonoid glycosyltransferase YjiC (YdhE family)
MRGMAVLIMTTEFILGAQTMWHGVPIVCLPGFGDQPDNAARAAAQGAGIALPIVWKVKEEKVYAALMRLLTEPSFKIAARKVSKRMSSQKRRGVERTAGGPLALGK